MAIRKIDLMQKIFGLSPTKDDTCIKCKNFIHNKGGYSKCKHYGYTHSEASDWKQKQRGCGLFNQDYTGRKVIELVRLDRRIEKSEIEGQMSFADFMDAEEFDLDRPLLKTTGCQRTGCLLCGFGCHLDKGEGRFERLKRTHPKVCNVLDHITNNGVTYRQAIDWINENNGKGKIIKY